MIAQIKLYKIRSKYKNQSGPNPTPLMNKIKYQLLKHWQKSAEQKPGLSYAVS